jgi:hypothetical protein
VGEFTWYSRLATWAGALVLLVQGVTGRSTGIMTLVGVILLAGGFAAFLSGLAFERSRSAEVIAADAVPQQEAAFVPPAAPPVPERLLEPGADASTIQTAEPVATPPPRVGVPAEEVSSVSPMCGMICPRCTQEVAVGQMAARCPVCGAAHHAACWIESRFHCSTPGCLGHGNLVEPEGAESG